MLVPGTRLGPYEVVAPLGAGGMGEVYRARDSRLERDVAVKVLPALLRRRTRTAAALRAGGPGRLRPQPSQHPRRPRRRRRTTASPYIVTELLEGETLRERLAGGAAAAAKAVEYAVQIAGASPRRTRRGSSTGTSSPRTCS